MIPACRDCGGGVWNTEGRCAACNTFPTLGYAVADFIEAKCVQCAICAATCRFGSRAAAGR